MGHVIRSLSLAAATTSLGNEPTVAGAVGTTVDYARRQCAAIAWLLSDVYSKPAVLALPPPSSTYLIKLLGLTAGPRAAEAQANRIAVHRTTHQPELADGAAHGDCDGHGNGGADGSIQGDDTC